MTVEIGMMLWARLTELNGTDFMPVALYNTDPAGLRLGSDSGYADTNAVLAAIKDAFGKHKSKGGEQCVDAQHSGVLHRQLLRHQQHPVRGDHHVAVGRHGVNHGEKGFPVAPAILGIVLGPLLEGSFMTWMITADGDLPGFVSRPVAATLGGGDPGPMAPAATDSAGQGPVGGHPEAVAPKTAVRDTLWRGVRLGLSAYPDTRSMSVATPEWTARPHIKEKAMTSQRFGAKSILIALVLAFGFILTGCEKEPEGAAEKAGKAIDQAAENAEDAVKDAAEDAGEKMEEAGEAVKKAAE